MVSFFLTHAEVVVEPARPIESWGLSDAGRSRAARAVDVARHPEVRRIVSSEERKAVETAAVLGTATGIVPTTHGALGEIDRSATGYLPFEEFEGVVDAFFSAPEESVRGWERAVDAQARIVEAVRRLTADDDAGDVTIVSHGAVGALLLADLRGVPISRALDQPGMGSVFAFDPRTWRATSDWRRVPAR
ncbi:histidine phosphatase family protein [Curtobacterium pusillum]|uniref:histidine phosphatase family protein n=1 Tax=Curtobacterium pusillum TaxID=69373 RepID=UPI0022F2D991|nr:histidine phosphatase family protein [Curtobacterium pusillum]GLK30310.1 phosphoglycerate mutase [Curtobacterium pusillum]